MIIRAEAEADHGQIRDLTRTAFAPMPYASGSEAAIIDGLRTADALTVSLVATDASQIVGHVAFSPVTIAGENVRWYGLGPVSVWPDRQRAGIGQALIREGLSQLRHLDAAGCVVLGDPAYYARFGFAADPALTYAGAPSRYFQCLSFRPPPPRGEVRFHPAFDIETTP
ncbi:MAG: N-acetyltransferase [Pseudomonadota bacterium]